MLTLSAAQVTKHNVTLYGAGKSVRVILLFYFTFRNSFEPQSDLNHQPHSTHSTAHTPPPLSERHLPGARRHASGHAGMQAADRGPQTAFCWKTPFCVTHSDCLHRTYLFTNSSFTLVCGRFTVEFWIWAWAQVMAPCNNCWLQQIDR